MKSLSKYFITLVLILVPELLLAYENLPDNGDMPDVVHLRKDCAQTNTDLKNCADNIVEMNAWIWSVRQPSASLPVVVHIGPGEYTGGFNCPNGSGHVSFIGSGSENTKLTSASDVVRAENCTDLHFQDMTMTATSTYTIRWLGGGSSRWVNVDVFGPWDAWLDTIPDCNNAHPVHYWFNSRLKHTANDVNGSTYQTGCGESWFYASELTYLVENLGSNIFKITGDADVRVFGSVLRAVVSSSGGPASGGVNKYVTGVIAQDNGSFHMHGGIISLIINSLSVDASVSALENYGNGLMHTPDTAFNLKPAGAGETYRTYSEGGAAILSPFMWPAGTQVPNLISMNGSDTFVETDCNADGDCDSGTGTETHMMIYNDVCNISGAWFDSVTKRCRGELPPAPPSTNGPDLPAIGVLGDTFVETDCESDGNCDSGTGTETHLMIYNDTCDDTSPWFDSTRGKCRGAP